MKLSILAGTAIVEARNTQDADICRATAYNMLAFIEGATSETMKDGSVVINYDKKRYTIARIRKLYGACKNTAMNTVAEEKDPEAPVVGSTAVLKLWTRTQTKSQRRQGDLQRDGYIVLEVDSDGKHLILGSVETGKRISLGLTTWNGEKLWETKCGSALFPEGLGEVDTEALDKFNSFTTPNLVIGASVKLRSRPSNEREVVYKKFTVVSITENGFTCAREGYSDLVFVRVGSLWESLNGLLVCYPDDIEAPEPKDITPSDVSVTPTGVLLLDDPLVPESLAIPNPPKLKSGATIKGESRDPEGSKDYYFKVLKVTEAGFTARWVEETVEFVKVPGGAWWSACKRFKCYQGDIVSDYVVQGDVVTVEGEEALVVYSFKGTFTAELSCGRHVKFKQPTSETDLIVYSLTFGVDLQAEWKEA